MRFSRSKLRKVKKDPKITKYDPKITKYDLKITK